MAGNKTRATTNIDPFETNKFGDSATKVARDPRSRPGLYYGSDNLRKIRLPNGEVKWVEKDVDSTRT